MLLFCYVQVYSKLDASMVNMCVAKAANDEEVLPTGITLLLKKYPPLNSL